MTSDIFIITSVINTGNNPWSYTGLRSCFTPEERLNQTIKTIETIRDLNDNTKIMLVECSNLDESSENILRSKVDYFIQTYNIEDIRKSCLETNKKGYGEIKKLQEACKFIKNNNISFNRLFKISGRYFLNKLFDKNKYDIESKFTFKMFNNNNGSTVLYSVPYSLFDMYIEKLNYCSNFYENNPPTGIETLIPIMCQPRRDIEVLGVSGSVAVLNDKGQSEFYTA
jgi:hypothetical protein